MDKTLRKLFSDSLQLTKNWVIYDIKSTEVGTPGIIGAYDVYIRWNKKYDFKNDKGDVGLIHDYSAERTWRHLNLLEHICFIHCRVPRIQFPNGEREYVSLPWAEGAKSSTKSFFMNVVNYNSNMPASVVSKMLYCDDSTILRHSKEFIDSQLDTLDLNNVRRIAVDETSIQKNHKYATTVIDQDTKKPIFCAEGNTSNCIDKFKEFFVNHKGKVENITDCTCDMYGGFISGFLRCFPNANITIDKFHVSKNVNDALDTVRRSEHAENKNVKNLRLCLLKNSYDLSEKSRTLIQPLLADNSKTSRAYAIKVSYEDFYRCQTKDDATLIFNQWCEETIKENLAPFNKLVTTLKSHLKHILNWFERRVTNSICECLNSIIQNHRNMCRGYRNFEAFKTNVFLKTKTFYSVIEKFFSNITPRFE